MNKQNKPDKQDKPERNGSGKNKDSIVSVGETNSEGFNRECGDVKIYGDGKTCGDRKTCGEVKTCGSYKLLKNSNLKEEKPKDIIETEELLISIYLHMKAGKRAYELRNDRKKALEFMEKEGGYEKCLLEAELHLEYCRENGIGIMSFRNEYLGKLEGEFSPTVLYYRGDPSVLDSFTVGFAGSRNASSYGLKSVRKILEELNERKIVTVSGGARGIDSACHRASMDIGIKTVCVLGGGILKPYPPENESLFRKISDEGGLILSEYPPLMSPRRYFFPERNRILAGLSDILIVPEASSESGSLHTAGFAEESGRRVITLPHDITRDTGKGCLELIASGADILSDYSDIRLFIP